MGQVTEKYKGWDVRILKNKFIKLFVAPQLGGRIMQVEMDGNEFLFNNPLLEGKEPDDTRLGKNGAWLNFGGEKIWPAPQGWDSPDQWPGPPDPVLDSGVYSVDNDKKEGRPELKLTSPVDYRTGLQIKKEIIIHENSSSAEVNVSFYNQEKNLGRWSIWPVIQVNTPGEDTERYRIVCPVNPDSKFPDGYKIMHGLANSPQYGKDASGNLVVNYRYLAGKVGLDSNAGWMAFMDVKTGKVFILSFEYHENASYPEDTSAQVWTMGRGIIYSRGKIIEYQNNKELNPPYMEMEILSPLQEIKRGKSFNFKYRLSCSTIPAGDELITGVNEYGIILRPLSLEIKEDNIIVEGRYGVFTEGKLKIILRAVSGEEIEEAKVLYEQDVSPLMAVNFKTEIKNMKLPDKGFYLSAVIYDNENFAGEIERVKIG